MASPDATPYVDLRLYDKDAQDVFEAALLNLQSWLPQWQAREGQTEVLLMQSLALQIVEAIFAINRVPGAVVEILIRLYGVERDLGSPPVASFQFTAVDTAGYTIPAGVRISLPLSGGLDPVVFTTDVPLLIAPGSTVGTVTATGGVSSTVANGVIPGSPIDLLDSVASVDRVDLASYVTGGVDVESDDDWFTRAVQRFSRLTETLVLPRHFVSAALEMTEVSRAFAVDNYDPTSGHSPGADGGHMTVAVYGNGDVLTSDEKEALRLAFDASAQANLAVHVIDPTLTDVNVTASVVGIPGYTAGDVQANCVAALTAYLSPEQWPWSVTVYRNELIALLDRVEGVDRVTSISVPAADLALTGVAPLARLGAATITVTGL